MELRWSSTLRRGALSCLSVLGLSAVSCTIDAGENPATPKLGVDDGTDEQDTGTVGLRNSSAAPVGDTTGSEGSSASQPGVDTDSQGQSSQDSAGVTSTDGPGETSTPGGQDTTTTAPTSEPGNNSSSSSTSMTTTEETTTECPNVKVEFTAVIPSIYLLVDYSGSMGFDINGGQNPASNVDTRWEIVQEALIGSPSGVVRRMQDKAKFAMSKFSAPGQTGAECPTMTHALSGPAGMENALPKLNNLPAIEQLFAANSNPTGYTPSGESIYAMWQEMKKNPDPNKILVFASDGDPMYPGSGTNCPLSALPDAISDFPESFRQQNKKDRVVSIVEDLYEDNISTFVISVGNGQSADPTHLDLVAKAGVGVTSASNTTDPDYPANPVPGAAQQDNFFFPGTSSSELYGAFESIILGSRPCKFTLEGGTVEPGHESEGTVTINGEEKTYNDPNGWKVNNGTEIELLGTSCTTVRQDTNVQLDVEFSCEAFTPG